jgi:hypothetical protein
MHLHRLAPLLALTLLAVPAAAGSATPSGLRGTVTRGPITPVCREDQPCDGPASVTLVFARVGAKPQRVRSAANGAYRILLRAGYYTVATTLNGPSRRTSPTRVHVRRGHVDKLDFTIDTGIR